MSEHINGLGVTPKIDAPRQGVGRRTAAKAQKIIDKTADRLSAGVTVTADKAQRTAERAADKAQGAAVRAQEGFRKATRTVDPIVHERPYALIGAGLTLGLLIGLAFAPRPRVVYVKPH